MAKKIPVERDKKILQIIVKEYNKTYEPVGSKLVAEKFGSKISSQTIRIVMAKLEKEGYLLKTHTSSGRIPSKKALEYFTNSLQDFNNINQVIIDRLQSIFLNRDKNIDNVIKDSLAILSDITQLPSLVNTAVSDEKLSEVNLVQLNNTTSLIIVVTDQGNIHKNYIFIDNQSQFNDAKVCIRLFNQHLVGTLINDLSYKVNELIPIIKNQVKEYEYITREVLVKFFNVALKKLHKTDVVGISSLSKYPEFHDPSAIFKILDMIESGSIWQQIQSEMDNDETNKFDDVQIEFKQIYDDDPQKVFMIATTEITYLKQKHQISLIGPARVEFAKIKGILNYLKNEIGKIISD